MKRYVNGCKLKVRKKNPALGIIPSLSLSSSQNLLNCAGDDFFYMAGGPCLAARPALGIIASLSSSSSSS